MPKLSIITVNLNNTKGLQKTIESVAKQTFTDYEYIIIDGGSTDGSVDIIKKHADKITYWVSEPDRGIYDAMNKAIKVAKGEWVYFLNSGDGLVNRSVLDFFLNNILIVEDFVYGNILLDDYILKYPEKLTFFFFYTNTICHQAIFIKRKLFDNFGMYNNALTIVADWEFYLRTIIDKKSTYKYINKTLCKYDLNGMSSDIKITEKLNYQRKSVLKDKYPMMYDEYQELIKSRNELKYYDNSKFVQLIKSFHNSKLYSLFKKIKSIK